MQILIVFSAVLACTVASPLVTQLLRAAPIGPDGRVVDTPEVSLAKAEHAAAHVNERINLARELERSSDNVLAYVAPSNVAVVGGSQLLQPVAVTTTTTGVVPGAPIGLDGRVVDTPEVTLARAVHAAAHVNERLGHEIARSASQPVVLLNQGVPLLNYYVH